MSSPDLAKLSDVTRRYGAWSVQEGGLPLAAGGAALTLCIFLLLELPLLMDRFGHVAPTVVHAWLALFPLAALILAPLPVAWILSKDTWRARLYEPFGRVDPGLSQLDRGLRVASLILLTTTGWGLPVYAALLPILHPGAAGMDSGPIQACLGITAAWTLPWLGWTRVRSALEHAVWVPMALLILVLCWMPLLEKGTAHDWPLGLLIVGAMLSAIFLGPVCLGLGLVQHLRFRRLRREMQGLAPIEVEP